MLAASTRDVDDAIAKTDGALTLAGCRAQSRDTWRAYNSHPSGSGPRAGPWLRPQAHPILFMLEKHKRIFEVCCKHT